MNTTPFPWKRGEDLSLSLRVKAGLINAQTPIRAVAKPVRSASSPVPDAETQSAFALTTTFVADQGDGFDRWTFAGTVAQSLSASPGIYVVDAAVEINGRTIITEPVKVELEVSVTGGFP